MRISIISHYPPIPGGMSKYTLRNVKILKNKKIDVAVIPVQNLINILRILNQIKKNDPDIIRLEFSISMYGIASAIILFQVLLAKILLKKKIVINFHEVSRDISMLGVVGIIFYAIISIPFDLIFVHTKHAKEILEKKCKISRQKIIVVPHGLYLPDNKKTIRNNISNKKKIILFFGFIHVHKGIEYLLDGYEILLKKHPKYLDNTILLIAGDIRKRKGIFKPFEKQDVDYYNNLKKRISNKKISLNIKFLGYVDDNKLNSLIYNSFAIVLPYIATEQSGVLNQALPSLSPIIGSNIGGIGETLKNSGILIEPRNPFEIYKSLEKLLSDNKYYTSVQNNYKNLVKELNPDLIANIYIDHYQSLLKASPYDKLK